MEYHAEVEISGVGLSLRKEIMQTYPWEMYFSLPLPLFSLCFLAFAVMRP